MQHVLVLAGEIGAGKSAIMDYLSGWYGAGKHKFSSPMRRMLEFLGQEMTRENLSRLSKAVRGEFGEDIFGEVLARDVSADPARLVVLDGARRVEDLGPISRLPGYRLVYIESSARTRYERIRRRMENAGEHLKTFEEFSATHGLETEMRIRQLRDIASDVVVNETDLAALHAQLDALMEKVGLKR